MCSSDLVVSLGSAQALAEAEWDRVIAINLKGTFLCCQAVLAGMQKRQRGRIVNIGSVVGKNGGNARPWISPEEQNGAGNIAYGVSKAGVHAMTAFLAREMAAHKVTVNAVADAPALSVGGMGTLWGPVVGALALHVLADLTRNLFGQLPGINMVIYGAVLVMIVMFLPRGFAGSEVSVRAAWQRWTGGRS